MTGVLAAPHHTRRLRATGWPDRHLHGCSELSARTAVRGSGLMHEVPESIPVTDEAKERMRAFLEGRAQKVTDR